MNKHLYKLTLAAAALALIATQSCKKDNDSQSRQDMLLGTWSAYQTGIDSNKNGVWDLNERRDFSPGAQGQLTLNAGGSGWLKGDTTLSGRAITWTLLNNETDLRLMIPVDSVKIDTVTLNLISVSTAELVMKNMQSGKEVYSSMRKR